MGSTSYILANEKGLEAHYEKFKEKFSFVVWDEKDIKKIIESKPMIRNFFINFLSKRILSKDELGFWKFCEK